MTPSDVWMSPSQLTGLPGLPGSEYRTRARLKALGIPSRVRQGRLGGGGLEYDCAALPAVTREALMLRQVQQAAPEMLPAHVPPQDLAPVAPRRPPSRDESACADARVHLVRQMRDMAHLAGGISHAAEQLSRVLGSGAAEAPLCQIAAQANQRQRQAGCANGVAISARTLFRWHMAYGHGGWSALLPMPVQPRPVAALADDVAAVLAGYASASGAARNLSHVAQAVTRRLGRPFDEWRKLYDRARRALSKVDKVKLIKARHTGAERAAKLPFKRRDSSVLAPLDVAVVDGHTFKAKVRHPDHGRPFAPEVTVVMDVATRRVTGWSVSLSESTIAVGDALRHAVGRCGVPAIVYSDNGAGESAKHFDCPVVGLFARLGVEHKTGIPGHPQGHGVIERPWQTHMIRLAREFASYQGSDVDKGRLRTVRLEIEREKRALRNAKDGDVVTLTNKVPPWDVFIAAVGNAFDRYNAEHRHRGLPKGADGKHITPDGAWALMLDPADQVMLDAATLRHVFMPCILRTAQRGEVRLLNQHYFAHELMQVDGQQVRVHYDIHDASRVWVWSTSGHFVCEAVWAANRIDYMPKPAIDLARAKRVQGMVRRSEEKIEIALLELAPPAVANASTPATAPLLVVADAAPPAAQPTRAEASGRPFFACAADRYEWLRLHQTEWTAEDTPWMQHYLASPEYDSLRDYFASRGLDWPSDQQAFDAAG